MIKHSLTAGQIACCLTAEKIEPLVQYVEQATATKLRIPDQQQTHKPHKPKRERPGRQ